VDLAPTAATTSTDSRAQALVKITLLSDDSIRYEPAPGMLTVEAESDDRQYSPFHMLGSSLAVCTFSVLASWATHANIPIDDLVMEVSWTFAEGPHRVDAVKLSFTWKSLPPNRLNAAKRAAALCPIHATLTHGGAAVTVEGAVS
jgi:uncharacterized OsmC-like protein